MAATRDVHTTFKGKEEPWKVKVSTTRRAEFDERWTSGAESLQIMPAVQQPQYGKINSRQKFFYADSRRSHKGNKLKYVRFSITRCLPWFKKENKVSWKRGPKHKQNRQDCLKILFPKEQQGKVQLKADVQ